MVTININKTVTTCFLVSVQKEAVHLKKWSDFPKKQHTQDADLVTVYQQHRPKAVRIKGSEYHTLRFK